MSGAKRALILVAAILLLFLAAGGAAAWLAFQDSRGGEPAAEPSLSLVEPVVAAALTGEPAQVSLEQANGFLAWLLEEKQPPQEDGISVEQITLSAGENGALELYAPVWKGGCRLAFSASVRLWMDTEANEICAAPEACFVGRLPVYPAWAAAWAAKRLPGGAVWDGEALRWDAAQLAIPLESLGTELALTGLTVGETGIEIQTESLTGLAGEELKDRLSCLVGDGLDPYLERFAEDLKDFFAKYAGN